MTSMERKKRILSKHQVLAMLPKIHRFCFFLVGPETLVGRGGRG